MSPSTNKVLACLVVIMFASMSFVGASTIKVDDESCGEGVGYTYEEAVDEIGLMFEAASENDTNPKVSNKWISCEGFTRLKYSTSTGNGLKVINYDGDDKDFIRVPDYIVYNGYTYVVDEISYCGLCTLHLFGRNPVHVELGPNIVKIDTQAFNCSHGINNTYKVTFRDIEHSKLEYIGDSAFVECRFTTMELPSSVTYISTCAFEETPLEDFKFNPTGLVDVCKRAFKGCTKLNSFPFEKVVSIGNNAFENCKLITDVDFENCKYIGDESFRGSGVKHFKFGYALEYIDYYAFDYDFYDADGKKLSYKDPSQFWGKEFNLVGKKYIAVQ